MKKPYWFTILILLAMILSACTSAATTVAPTTPPEPTEAPAEVVVEPTLEPTKAPEPTTLPEPTEAPPVEEKKMILATTTSTQDSGLLDYLLPMFKDETGITTEVIAVGSGQALQLGKDGNADVLLVHSPAAEQTFMDEKHGVRREDVMYNDFVIVGPESDPAGIKGMTSAVDAFKKIAETQSQFVSRGDDSGTHVKEQGLWKKAELEPAGDWYISAGASMGEVLSMSDEKLAYTLSDRATYLARTKEGLDLDILVEGDSALFNPYGVIAVDPQKNDKIKNDLANQFTDWITSVPVQEKIAEFGKEEFGNSLFFPSSALWLAAQSSAAPSGDAALKITGKVKTEQAWSEEEVKALPTIDVESTNKAGEKSTYTGVLISDLLKLAEPLPEATTVVFVADDGYTAEIALADVMNCTNCIVSFRSQGGFSTVLPGMAGSLQVKGVVEIQVK